MIHSVGIELTNDKGELLGKIIWFSNEGPYYAYAVDLREPEVGIRIGPHSTLEGAKASVLAVLEGKKDVNGRAEYPRVYPEEMKGDLND